MKQYNMKQYKFKLISENAVIMKTDNWDEFLNYLIDENRNITNKFGVAVIGYYNEERKCFAVEFDNHYWRYHDLEKILCNG